MAEKVLQAALDATPSNEPAPPPYDSSEMTMVNPSPFLSSPGYNPTPNPRSEKEGQNASSGFAEKANTSSPASAGTNPGFCELAFRERRENSVPGGGMFAAEYFAPCKACGFECGDKIPKGYKEGWLDWVDPSVNFRWESHVVTEKAETGEKKETLGCWICWEYNEQWREPMEVEEWYKHMRRHFFVEGYRICRGKTGGMQRRRNCELKHCPKIHS